MRLDLDADSARVLVRVLEIELSELSSEIADTDRKAYRDILKHRAEVIRRVVRQIRDRAPEVEQDA